MKVGIGAMDSPVKALQPSDVGRLTDWKKVRDSEPTRSQTNIRGKNRWADGASNTGRIFNTMRLDQMRHWKEIQLIDVSTISELLDHSCVEYQRDGYGLRREIIVPDFVMCGLTLAVDWRRRSSDTYAQLYYKHRFFDGQKSTLDLIGHGDRDRFVASCKNITQGRLRATRPRSQLQPGTGNFTQQGMDVPLEAASSTSNRRTRASLVIQASVATGTGAVCLDGQSRVKARATTPLARPADKQAGNDGKQKLAEVNAAARRAGSVAEAPDEEDGDDEAPWTMKTRRRRRTEQL